MPAPQAEIAPEASLAGFAALEDVLALLREAREIKLLDEVEAFVQLIAFRPGLIEFAPTPDMPQTFPHRLAERLGQLTGARWSVALGQGPASPSIAATRHAQKAEAAEAALAHPLVAAVIQTFPGAQIHDIRSLDTRAARADPEEYLAPAEERDEIEGDLLDSDDPFEEN